MTAQFRTAEILKDFAKSGASPRRSFAAQECADQLEALDMSQVDESERQLWTPAYKDRVTQIIDLHMSNR